MAQDNAIMLVSGEADYELLEQVIIKNDLGALSPQGRVEYYGRLCKALGLNPLTRPFEYLTFQNKLTLYAKKDATEQLARKQGLSVRISDPQIAGGLIIVRATASDGKRSVDATGVVAMPTGAGEVKANAIMKAETKASRRAVLRFSGLGWLDETEIVTTDAALIDVDPDTGEILTPATPALVFEDESPAAPVPQAKPAPKPPVPRPTPAPNAKSGWPLKPNPKQVAQFWEAVDEARVPRSFAENVLEGQDPGEWVKANDSSYSHLIEIVTTAWREFQPEPESLLEGAPPEFAG